MKAKMNPLQKADYLRLLRAGGLRYESATKVGASAESVRISLRDDEDFRRDCQDAVLEANEPVETALYVAAKAGEPWAVQFYLKHRDKERWGEQAREVRITHELDGAELLKAAADIAGQLQRRRQLAESSIDVPATEHGEARTDYYDTGESPMFKSIALQKKRLPGRPG